MLETLTVTIENGLARVELNRPDVRNAFNEQMIADLAEVFTSLDQDPDVSAVLLTGTGPTFCAGGDLNWMRKAAGYSRDENITDAMRMSDMFLAIDTCSKPVVALVHGAAMGGGVGVVACADSVIAVEGTKFALSEAKLGLIPGAISPFVVRSIGERWARRLFTTAEIFDANAAQHFGLVHDVVADLDAGHTLASKLVKLIQSNGPNAVSNAKKLAVDVAGEPITQALRTMTAERIADQRATPEGIEGVTAFLEKRKPSWLGGER